jgi:hypothetical protein
MKWILIVHALLNKFIPEIQISNSVIIKLNNLLKIAVASQQKSTHHHTETLNNPTLSFWKEMSGSLLQIVMFCICVAICGKR